MRLFIILALVVTVIFCIDVVQSKKMAVCKIRSGSGNGTIEGIIYLTQTTIKAEVRVTLDLKGFNVTASKKHGFHVHQNGSLDNKCAAAGPHLNVDKTPHGSPSDPPSKRHTGDLGNIEIDSDGNIDTTLTDRIISLYKHSRTSVIGRAMVVHELVDDLGRGKAPTSNTTGNSGQRLGCCVIRAIKLPDC